MRARPALYTTQGQQGHPGTSVSPAHLRRAFDWLLHRTHSQPEPSSIVAWRWLEAAHVLGQASLALHWRAHEAMLQLAWTQGNVREVTGQLLRLALVPLGHFLQRLPAGNSGRANVSAFRPMVPSAEITALIQHALKETL